MVNAPLLTYHVSVLLNNRNLLAALQECLRVL